jgi:hypothetical protein
MRQNFNNHRRRGAVVLRSKRRALNIKVLLFQMLFLLVPPPPPSRELFGSVDNGVDLQTGDDAQKGNRDSLYRYFNRYL